MTNKADYMNRMWNVINPNQGKATRVLCLCSAGLLRSPTTAWVLSNDPWNFNTRAAGIESYALIQFDPVLAGWAEVILCMDKNQMSTVTRSIKEWQNEGIIDMNKKLDVFSLEIPDKFPFKHPDLIKLIKESVEGLL